MRVNRNRSIKLQLGNLEKAVKENIRGEICIAQCVPAFGHRGRL